jgi:hypothetical protein
VVAAG